MEKYNIVLLKIDSGAEVNSVIYADENGIVINLKISIDDKEIIFESEQYLKAYQKIRDELLKNGYGLKCKGSLINACQSGMMSYTSKVYLVQKGRQALQKDIVNIWEYCDIKHFPTTIEQKNFIEEWYISLKERYYVN